MGTRREVSFFFFILCFYVLWSRSEMSVSSLRRPAKADPSRPKRWALKGERAENEGKCVRNELRIIIKERRRRRWRQRRRSPKKNKSLNLPNRTIVVDSLCPSIYNTLLLFRWADFFFQPCCRNCGKQFPIWNIAHCRTRKSQKVYNFESIDKEKVDTTRGISLLLREKILCK